MRIRKFGALLTTSLAAALVTLTFSTAPLSAQEAAVIKGKVTSETGEALGGANVTVAGTNQGVVTTANGTFTLTIGGAAAKGQQVVLIARYIGHKPVSRTVTLNAGEQEQNFQLAADPLRLEEVVVTGVGEATDRRKLPNVVASVSAEQLQAVPGQSALQAVEGKVAGVRLIPNSAQPGGEPSLRLRGATSIGGRQDPLYIVDGVIRAPRPRRCTGPMRQTGWCRSSPSAAARCPRAGFGSRPAWRAASTTCRPVCSSLTTMRGK
jgi:hypothetical protein